MTDFEANFRAVVKALVPPLGTIVFLLVLLNAYIIFKQNMAQRPSLRIYLHILAVDCITVVGGVMLVLYLNKGWNFAVVLFRNANWLTFYSYLTLFFCLAVARILIIRGNIMSNGSRVAMIMIVMSSFIGIAITVIHHLVSYPDYKKYPIPSAVQSVVILTIGLSTLCMNFYITLTTLYSQTNHHIRAAANFTAILFFVNNFLCSLFSLTVNGYFLYQHSKGEECPSEVHNWLSYFVCTSSGRHYLELAFLLLQSVGNNVLMLLQRYSRDELQVLCWRLCSSRRGSEEEYSRYYV